ncbi:DUF2079 domain-containing protein [Streptomyces sp. Ac-502]|uniref:DUF2079 domain-containing protein n=1 Tax=Streptomyces sp. Ac-502 TaxID=3342801 RepID=UPI0038624F50
MPTTHHTTALKGGRRAGPTAPPPPSRTPFGRCAERVAGFLSVHRTRLWVALCFSISLALGLQQWSAGKLGGFDLGIFDQAIRNYSGFRLPRSELKSTHHGFPADFSVLGDHFSPVLALLAPLYWIWDDPRVLLIAQAALFAAGVPVVRRIAESCFQSAPPPVVARAANVAGAAYALGWPLMAASRRGFHEVAFAVPLLLLLLERGMRRRYGAVLVYAGLLCCTKEDLGLVVGVYGAVLAHRSRRGGVKSRAGVATGAALFVLGPAATIVTIKWLLPMMGGAPGFYWSYHQLGPDFGAALLKAVTEPWVLFGVATAPPVKITLIMWLFGTLLFLPLGSATVWCALPLVAERVLSETSNHWTVMYHYDAFLWPILLTAGVEVSGRLHRRSRTGSHGNRRSGGIRGIRGNPRGRGNRRPSWAVRWWGPGAGLLTLVIAVPFGLFVLPHPGYWTPDSPTRALREAAGMIPDGASAEVDNIIAPHLTARGPVVLADTVPRGADYVLLQFGVVSFPFTSVSQERQYSGFLLEHGYRRVWERDQVMLLRREAEFPITPEGPAAGPESNPAPEGTAPRTGMSIFRG